MPGNNIPITVIGLNFKTAPIEVRETVQSTIDTAYLFATLRQTADFQGAVLLKTCNRIELYIHGAADDIDPSKVLGPVVQSEMMYVKKGKDAIGHLFSVASSLDSMVVGEPQILGQVKQAYEYAKKHHYISPLLDQIFQKAFQVAKRVRNETSIGDYTVSLSSIVVELTKEFFDEFEKKEVLIIGAGQMAELAAKHYAKAGIRKIWIMNRSFDHAVALAKKCNGTPMHLDQMVAKLKDIDVLLTSTGADQHLLRAEQMKPYTQNRKHRPLLCIDISVPRNLDPLIHELDDVYLYGIDDLQTVVDQHIEIRESEASQAHEMIDQLVEQFLQVLSMPSISETVQKIHQKIEPVCEQELRRLSGQIQISDEDLEKIRKSFYHFAQKLLLNPVIYIQDTEDKEDRNKRLNVVRNIFLVDKESS